jgi:hypothetical protein
MEPTETVTDDQAERERVGQRLNALQTARRIENYYYARGEWHIIRRGNRIVLRPEQVDVWLSGFRHGLVEGAQS